MSKQAQKIIDSIKNNPEDWDYSGTGFRHRVSQLTAYHNGLFAGQLKVRVDWEESHDTKATFRQRWQFGRLDYYAMEALRDKNLDRAIARLDIIEVNPPAAGQQVVI